MEHMLREAYTDPADPGSYGGIQRLLASARKRPGLEGVKLRDVRNFLRNEEAYTLHRPIRRRFRRNPTIVSGIDDQWQADLADLVDVVRYNDSYRYILTVIDCFSKYAWAIPTKRKDAESLVVAFKQLFSVSEPRKPRRLQTDKGKEFFNAPVQKLFKTHHIVHFATENETKASIVERFNRTLKTRMFTYFTLNNTYRWIEVLPKLVQSYNQSKHRTIGMRPVDITKANEKKVWHRMYGKHMGRIVPRHTDIPTEATVRISKAKTTFEKGYLPNWTNEVFKVNKADVTAGKQQYHLRDMLDEPVAGRFYAEEIQQVRAPELYKIEKVLRRRTLRDGSVEQYVKWKGYPDKFNSWVKDTSVVPV